MRRQARQPRAPDEGLAPEEVGEGARDTGASRRGRGRAPPRAGRLQSMCPSSGAAPAEASSPRASSCGVAGARAGLELLEAPLEDRARPPRSRAAGPRSRCRRGRSAPPPGRRSSPASGALGHDVERGARLRLALQDRPVDRARGPGTSAAASRACCRRPRRGSASISAGQQAAVVEGEDAGPAPRSARARSPRGRAGCR